MKYSNEELKKLWSNNENRKNFAKLYKDWGVYSEAPELNLTFYKYDLPDGTALIVMEHMHKQYNGLSREFEWHMTTKIYLQREEYFTPNLTPAYKVNEHLKNMKKLI